MGRKLDTVHEYCPRTLHLFPPQDPTFRGLIYAKNQTTLSKSCATKWWEWWVNMAYGTLRRNILHSINAMRRTSQQLPSRLGSSNVPTCRTTGRKIRVKRIFYNRRTWTAFILVKVTTIRRIRLTCIRRTRWMSSCVFLKYMNSVERNMLRSHKWVAGSAALKWTVRANFVEWIKWSHLIVNHRVWTNKFYQNV